MINCNSSFAYNFNLRRYIMGNDAIEDENWFAANKARYTQAKRHAWGAIDLAYIVCQYVSRMDRVPFRKVGRRIYTLSNPR